MNKVDIPPDESRLRKRDMRREEMDKHRKTKEKYGQNKEKFEGFVSKFIGYALKLKVFKDKDNKIKKSEDTLYYGFDKEGFHYTVRRDKI